MNKLLKRSLIAMTLAGVMTSSAFAATLESSKVGITQGGIKGWQPYMQSIGTKMISGGKDDGNGVFLPAVGSVIEIPTYATSEDLFKFIDKDGDIPAGLGYATLPNGAAAQKEFRVEWYAIVAKNGDWNAVQSWDDVTATLIPTEIAPAGLNEKNKNSATLVVPETAIGARLGFIAYPESETGIPSTGVPVKAWDLSQVWTQTPPTNPGECVEGDPDCSDNGTPGGENPGGGGGEVQPSEFAINIYDATTNLVVKPGDELLVEKTYFATIRINNGDNTYREPTATELESLKWNLVDKDGVVVDSYGFDHPRVDIKSGETFGPDKFVKYKFTTQTTNADSADKFGQIAPNFSEQGFGLYVTLETAE